MVNSPLIRPYFLGGGGIGGVPLDSHDDKCSQSIKNLNGTEFQRTPFSKLLARAMIDNSGVFSGSVKRGSCWRFLGNIAPENRPLKKEISIGNHHFQGRKC